MEMLFSQGYPPGNDVRRVMMSGSGKRKATPVTAKVGPSSTPSSSAAAQSTQAASTGDKGRSSQPTKSHSAQTSHSSRQNAGPSSHPTSSASSSKNASSGTAMAQSAKRSVKRGTEPKDQKRGDAGSRSAAATKYPSQGGKLGGQVARDTDEPKKNGRSTPAAFPLAPLGSGFFDQPAWKYESSQESVKPSRRRTDKDEDSKRKRTNIVEGEKTPISSRPASPDETNLTDNSHDPSLSCSPAPSTSKSRSRRQDVKREPLRSSPDKANLPDVFVPSSSQESKASKVSKKAGGKRIRREASSISAASDESNTTPRAVKTKTARGGQSKSGSQPFAKATTGSQEGGGGSQSRSQGTKRVRRRVESDDKMVTPEPEGVGAAFFRQLKGMSQRDRTHEWGHGEDSDIGEQLLVASQDLSPSPPTLSPGTRVAAHDSGLTAEDLEYLQDFVCPDELCQYCREPMPAQRTRYLQDQATELERIRWTEYDDDELPWDLTINFCETHRAEARVIPLGLREGYPGKIEFSAMPSRLEDAIFREDMEDLMASPEDSPLFRRIVKRISKIGRGAWKKLVKLGDKKSLDLAMVGYYGYIGRQIISYYYETLLSQGLLPSLNVVGDDPSPVAPLTPREFVEHVLVPEAGIRLIMADQGWKGEHAGTDRNEWSAARTQAYQTWKDSTEYGKWKFRGEGPEEKGLLEDVKAGMRERLDEWKQQREHTTRRRRKPSEVIDLDLVSSQASIIDVDATPTGKKGSPIKVDASPVAPREPKTVNGDDAATMGERISDDVDIPDTQSSFGGADSAWWGQVMEETGDVH